MNESRVKEFRLLVKGATETKKERDYNILEALALQPQLTQEEIISLFQLNVTQPCISKIVRENMQLYLNMVVHLNPLATDEGRITELIKHYYRREKQGSKKDIADLLEQIRHEVKGDKPIIDQSQHLHLINNISLEEFRKLPIQDKIKDILNRK